MALEYPKGPGGLTYGESDIPQGGMPPLELPEQFYSSHNPQQAQQPQPQRPQAPSGQLVASPYDDLFRQKEQQYGLPPNMLKALAEKESSYRPDVLGQPITSERSAHRGHRAMGLFQFMPNTWKGEGHVGDPLNPNDATEAAAKKLSAALKKRGTVGGALLDYYGRGIAPDGHPTGTQYMQDVIDKMNLYNGAGQPRPRSMNRMTGTYLPDRRGDTGRGLKHAAWMWPQTAHGLQAGAGAVGEWAFGEGGLSTSMKETGLKNWEEYQKSAWTNSKQTDDLDYSMRKAVVDGDWGALVDWMQYAIGYGGGNLISMLGTGVFGGIAARWGAKKAVEKLMRHAVDKEAKKLAKNKTVDEAIRKQAVKNIAYKAGQYGALGGVAYGMEGGEIGGGLAQKATEEGRTLTGEEISRGIGTTLAAGSLEFLNDVLNLKVITGGAKGGIGKLKGGRIKRGMKVALPLAGVEAGTEGAQTYLEEYGISGQAPSSQTHRAAFNAAGLGGVAGGGAGFIGGFASPNQAPAPPPPRDQRIEPTMQPPAPSAVQVETAPRPADATEQQDFARFQRMQEEAALIPQNPTEAELTPQPQAQQPSMSVEGVVGTMMEAIFGKRRATKQAKVYMDALRGDPIARAAVIDAIRANPREGENIEQQSNAAIAVIDKLANQLQIQERDEKLNKPRQVETVQPGETTDLFGGPARTPTTRIWDLIRSNVDEGITNEEFPIRAQLLEQQYNEAVAKGDLISAREIYDLAIDELSAAFWEGNPDPEAQLKALQEVIRDKVETEFTAYRQQYDALDEKLNKAKEDKKPRLRRRIVQLNTAWQQREAELQQKYFDVMANPDLGKPRKIKHAKTPPGQAKLPLRFHTQRKGGTNEKTTTNEDTSAKQGQRQGPEKSQNKQPAGKRLLKSILRVVTGKKSGNSATTVEGWLKDLQGPRMTVAHVVQSAKELPQKIKNRMTAEEMRDARGLWDEATDEVYIMADNIHDKSEAVFVYLHEAAHKGLAQLFGRQVEAVMARLYDENPRLKAKADQYIREKGLTKEEATEEALADMANDHFLPNLNGWQDFLRVIRDWLERMVGSITTKGITDREIEMIVGAATRIGIRSDVRDVEVAMRMHELKAVDELGDGEDRVSVALDKIERALLNNGFSQEDAETYTTNIYDKAKARIADDVIRAAKAGVALSDIDPAPKKIKLSQDSTPTYERVVNVLTDKKGTAREIFGTAFPDYVMRNFATLGQLVDVIKNVLPAATSFDKFIRQMQASDNDTINKTAPIATRWGALLAPGNEARNKQLNDFITETEALGMRPDVERGFDDFANMDGRNNFENTAQARAKYDELVNKWNNLEDPELQRIYTEQANLSTEMIKYVVAGMIRNIENNIPDSTKRQEMIHNLKKRWKHPMAGRPWIPHKRFGEYVVIVTAEDGTREVFGYETKVQATEMAEVHKERYKDYNPKVRIIKGTDVYSNLDGVDKSFIDKIKTAVTQNVTDPDEVQKLALAVEEIYVAALPEMSGAKRLIARKNIPGWSTEYRRSWTEAIMSMSRYASKLHYMDDLRDSVEDAGRQAGKDKTIYAITYWDKDKGILQTQFRNSALGRTRFIRSLGPNMRYDEAVSHPDNILALVKKTYYDQMTRADAERAFVFVEKQFGVNKEDTKVPAPYEDAILSSRYYNLLRDRYSNFLTHKPRGPISNLLVNLGFINYLGWTPAFAFMNITQVAMLTFPRLAARYGAGNASDAIKKGYAFANANSHVFKQLMGGAWTRTGIDSLNIDKFNETDGTPLSQKHRDVLDYLLKHGKLDFTQGSELNEITENTPKWAQRVIKSSSWLAHPTEVLNRVVTAVATYELSYNNASPALSAEAKHNRAIIEAVEVLDTTQYDYSQENRPQILQHPTARVMLQFRQFSQQTAWQIGKALKQALSKLPSEQRREQRAYLLYILASTLTLAGVRGMPAAGLVFMLASMFGDEGDDLEFELQKGARDILGDTFGPMLTSGIFTGIGIDASRNIGLGDIWPGTNIQSRATSSKDKFRDVMYDAAGPTIAMFGNILTGIDTIEKGDVWRGVEESLPKAFRTPLKAMRLNNRGLETKSGIVRVKGTDITPWELIVTAAGLKPDKVGWVQDQVGYVQQREAAIRMQGSILRKRMQFAVKYGDKEEVSTVQRRINEFNKVNPDFRVTPKSLKPPFRAQAIADMTGGISSTKGQLNIYRTLMNDGEEEEDFLF